MKFGLVIALALAGASSHALAQATVSEVEVAAPTPLSRGQANLEAVAGPVQTATAQEIEQSRALDLSSFLSRRLAGVYVNDIQNNPLQPDLSYRGFTASPLLGTPQGLSVYVDGVRLNQPFGEVVSWDLIPKAAIRDVTLAPGSNPLFGLNTLGGALSIRTKDGLTAPGSTVQAAYGSYDRWQVQGETGGRAGAFDWYLTANRLNDDGWRRFSPTEATQAFAKLGWSGADTRLSLSAAFADTDLTGNGMQELQFLRADRRSVYTKPDNTKNQSYFLTLAGEHRYSDRLTVSGNGWWRRIKTRTLNGDINDDSLGENVLQPSAGERTALAAAGYRGFPVAGETAANTPFPMWRCVANALTNEEPNEKCNGLLNRGRSMQTEAGASGQLAYDAGRHKLVAGGSYSLSRTRFRQSSQFGFLTPDRGVIGVSGPGAFADGTQDSENAFDARVDLRSRVETFSFYAADTIALTPALTLTLSGRYQNVEVNNRDAVTPSGSGSLTADHRFERFNPAAVLTFSPSEALTAYLGYSEGARAPSAIELGCSDPLNPCRLPNALAGDPPLKQVVTRTGEAGLRGVSGGINWSAGLFRAENHQDIQFVADGTAGYGYFKNFGKTRREGIELAADTRVGPFTLGGSYSYLSATFRSEEVVNGEGNSSNDDGPGFEGTIVVEKGDRIPLVPRHVFKADLHWQATPRLRIDADMAAVGGVFARGNENNRHRPDGVYYLGPGKTDAYAVFNLGGEYRPVPALKLFVQVSNLFDKKYETAAQLGPTGFTASGDYLARPFAGPTVGGELPLRGSTFFAPGAPRMIWAGISWSF
jgi:outer membrane receptor protein involved in Fe transport